jgi:hypothetical protein
VPAPSRAAPPVRWASSGSQFSKYVGGAMSPFRPMNQFDPSQPALVHDRLNAKTFEWSPEWRPSFERYKREAGLGVVSWDGAAAGWMGADRSSPD